MCHESPKAKPYDCHHLVSLCDSHGKSKQVYIVFGSHWTVPSLDHTMILPDLSRKYTQEQVATSPHRITKCWGVRRGFSSRTLQCATVTINLFHPNPIIKPTPGLCFTVKQLLEVREVSDKISSVLSEL